MAPFKSTGGFSVGKLLGVFRNRDLTLNSSVKTNRYVPPPLIATGGTVTTNGSYTVHTFSYPNTDDFVVSSSFGEIFYLVVAGGGGGSSPSRGGGGGAGGCRSNHPSVPSPLRGSPYTISPGTYPVVVGQGGLHINTGGYSAPQINRNGVFNPPASPFPASYGESGGNSSFNSGGVNGYSPIVSTGGGGGNNGPAGNPTPGARGGSGGGGGDWDAQVPAANVAVGNYPVVSPPQGNPGGATKPGGPSPYASGGGGGWGGAGQYIDPSIPAYTGRGGASVEVTISGTPTTPAGEYYGGGGQGSGNAIPSSIENDPTGKSGGQVNAPFGPAAGVDGTGGGGAARSGGDGGHGVVIISYLSPS